MKKGRTILSDEHRMEVLERDGSDRCVLCGRQGQDFEHAFPLGNWSVRDKEILNQPWNISIVCRPCHTKSQTPSDKLGWDMRIQLMTIAYYRYIKGKDRQDTPLYKELFQLLKGKRQRMEILYGDKSVDRTY